MGLLEMASRDAGLCVGMTAALGKKFTRVSLGGVTRLGGCLIPRWLVRRPALVRSRRVPSKVSTPKSPRGEKGSLACVPREARPVFKREEARPSSSSKTQDLRSVSPEEVRAAVFLEAAIRVIFTRAHSDLASPDATVRANAAKSFGTVRHPLSIRVLVAQSAREPSPLVRKECIKSLTALDDKKTLPTLQRALSDPVSSVRLAALWGVYRLAGADSASAIASMLSDGDEEVRRRAASCLGWLGSKEFVGALLPLLADAGVSVRRAAAEAVAGLRSPRAIPPLIECLRDPDDSIRKAALGSLESITGKRMSESSPADEDSRERLIARWRAWWRDEELRDQGAPTTGIQD